MNNWGYLILLDSPPGLQFGIDNSSWKIGNKFKGIRNIPYGCHFAHYSLADENHQFKQFFFFVVNAKNRVCIKRYNKELQDFASLENDEEERYSDGAKNLEFEAYLGPYPETSFDNWRSISYNIDERVLEKLNVSPFSFSQLKSKYTK